MKNSKLFLFSLAVWILSLFALGYTYLRGYGPWQKHIPNREQNIQLEGLAVGKRSQAIVSFPDLHTTDITQSRLECSCLQAKLLDTPHGLEWRFVIEPKVTGYQAPMAKLYVFGESAPRIVMFTGDSIDPISWNKGERAQLHPGDNTIMFKPDPSLWPHGLQLKPARLIGGTASMTVQGQEIHLNGLKLDNSAQPTVQLLCTTNSPDMPWTTYAFSVVKEQP